MFIHLPVPHDWISRALLNKQDWIRHHTKTLSTAVRAPFNALSSQLRLLLVLLLLVQRALSGFKRSRSGLKSYVVNQIDFLQWISMYRKCRCQSSSYTLQHRHFPQHPTCLQVQTGYLSHQRIEVSWAKLKSRTPEIVTPSKLEANARCLQELRSKLANYLNNESSENLREQQHQQRRDREQRRRSTRPHR